MNTKIQKLLSTFLFVKKFNCLKMQPFCLWIGYNNTFLFLDASFAHLFQIILNIHLYLRFFSNFIQCKIEFPFSILDPIQIFIKLFN